MTDTGISAAAGIQATARARPVDPAPRTQERAMLEKAALGFEAIFTRQMLSTMRNASLGESIDGSSAVAEFQEMADANMSDGLARQGGLGIAAMILKQLDNR
jgi:peptidoglycan hydrolase FlgJ